MFSIATAPAKQSVSETISVLSGRLTSATLLEDRRAAILGLRSFAKQYPASVASGALRSLIGSLSKDGEDVDTVKVVLETLLMLFNPNEDSPEASEEIALWLADEFTQRQENITLLLDFLETTDFYSRLYSLQLLSAILSARTERTEECVFTAPLGIPRLVAILDDRREAVRNEAITLLTSLTPTSLDIQKAVAFDNAFDRVFSIVAAEGSVYEGGRVVEDCLILLANLLRLNASNQSHFRETSCIPQLSTLLESTYGADKSAEEVASWALAQRNRNIYALLAVIRLFLVSGAVGTVQNQEAFWRHGLLYHALQLSFGPDTEVQIKAEALITCADIIRGNSSLQESFAQLQVSSSPQGLSAGVGEKVNGVAKVYVIDGLLDMTLGEHAVQAFDARMAACECLKAYFSNHPEVRLHFLRRAIDGHNSGADETANVLTTLLRSPVESTTRDPYRYWFAAVIMFHLLYENPTAKALAMAVTEGDESSGEEVVTSIQTITAHLLGSLAKGTDQRVIAGYSMLLLCWLFEDLDGVNDFLAEGSNIHSLIQAVVKNAKSEIITGGLCAVLLGVIYEFSTKDSPIPRATLQSMLVKKMGRDRYVDKLNQLRTYPLLRDFEVIPQRLDLALGQKLPDVFFDAAFVDFFKDNYSRLIRAIDRDPGIEISVFTNGVQKGISREMVDSLRAQNEEKERALQDIRVKVASVERQLGQEQSDHRRAKETATVDLAKVKTANNSLQRQNEEEISKLRTQHRLEKEEVQSQVDHTRRMTELEAGRVQRRHEAEMADLRATNSRLEVDLMKANKSKTQELQATKDNYNTMLSDQMSAHKEAEERSKDLQTRLQAAETKAQAADRLCQDLETRLQLAEADGRQVESLLEQKEGEKQATQTELDDLLMVFGDLEDKVKRYKERLKALGEQISDVDDDDDGDGDGDEDEDEDDVD